MSNDIFIAVNYYNVISIKIEYQKQAYNQF